MLTTTERVTFPKTELYFTFPISMSLCTHVFSPKLLLYLHFFLPIHPISPFHLPSYLLHLLLVYALRYPHHWAMSLLYARCTNINKFKGTIHEPKDTFQHVHLTNKPAKTHCHYRRHTPEHNVNINISTSNFHYNLTVSCNVTVYYPPHIQPSNLSPTILSTIPQSLITMHHLSILRFLRHKAGRMPIVLDFLRTGSSTMSHV
jgi:hypothetical protein